MEIMKAYKFRGADQIPFALDIVFNQRLYCSDWASLNDPGEGLFVCSGDSNSDSSYEKRVEKIISEKKRLKVCSLSLTFDCHLLWSHYASGFSGLAIEMDLPDQSPVVRVVKYRGVFAEVTDEDGPEPSETADLILSSKYHEWAYEKEVRILQQQEWFTLDYPITRIICGHRMDDSMLEAFKVISKSRNIRISGLRITDGGLIATDFHN
jgi:hypothetical protein